jgi:hypothetical protein
MIRLTNIVFRNGNRKLLEQFGIKNPNILRNLTYQNHIKAGFPNITNMDYHTFPPIPTPEDQCWLVAALCVLSRASKQGIDSCFDLDVFQKIREL